MDGECFHRAWEAIEVAKKESCYLLSYHEYILGNNAKIFLSVKGLKQ